MKKYVFRYVRGKLRAFKVGSAPTNKLNKKRADAIRKVRKAIEKNNYEASGAYKKVSFIEDSVVKKYKASFGDNLKINKKKARSEFLISEYAAQKSKRSLVQEQIGVETKNNFYTVQKKADSLILDKYKKAEKIADKLIGDNNRPRAIRLMKKLSEKARNQAKVMNRNFDKFEKSGLYAEDVSATNIGIFKGRMKVFDADLFWIDDYKSGDFQKAKKYLKKRLVRSKKVRD